MVAVAQGTLTGRAKLEAVTNLMNQLKADLKSSNLSPQQRDALLEELKVYGRDPVNSDPIFTREGVEILTRYAFDSSNNTTCRNALRVLCNAMYLRPATRQLFVDMAYEAKACVKLKNDNRDDEFLVSRLLFLTTYDTTIDLGGLIDQHHLADIIVQNLARHAKRLSASVRGSHGDLDPTENMALAETLKLLFNVTHFTPDRVNAFTPAVPHIITILTEHELPAPHTPLAPPFGHAVNALINLKLDDEDALSSLFPKSAPSSVADRLLYLLDQSLASYSDDELEANCTPLVTLIMTIHEHAPAEVRSFIRQKLLPTEEDRKQILGRGNSLTSRLLRTSTNALTPKLREAISHLLFDMSDKDANRFVLNVGYGYASGFLFQNNIPIPESASGAQSSTAGGNGRPINPITGQYVDEEKEVEMPQMSQEEKEREAERLFVLFERLKATGIMDVQNPVEKAYQEGRIRELDSDEE